SSVPIRDGDWLYWWAFTPGDQYRRWWRRPGATEEDKAGPHPDPLPQAGEGEKSLGRTVILP
ncbi:MAG TPA: hypothetical protein VHN20_12590, partial [Beijerinckiaceae bacterium]|nr:hypothetical protein [Beijerinckiaceae bacterium]